MCNASQDPIELLKLIRSALHKHDNIKQGTMAFVEQDIRLFTMWQKPEQSPLEFVKQVKAQADVINVHGGNVGYHPELYKAHLAEWMDFNGEDPTVGPSPATKKAAMESSCEEYLACFAIRTADNNRFKTLKNELDNDYLKGKDTYPKKMEDALRLMQNHKSVIEKTTSRRGGNKNQAQQQKKADDDDEKGVAFGQTGEKSGEKGGKRDISNHDCFNCGEKGHHAVDCPKLNSEQKKLFGMENLVVGDDDEESDPEGLIEGVGFIQPAKITCDREKLYLDSCATNSSMFADEFLSNTHTAKIALRQNCNAGSRTLSRMGTWMRFPMWENSNGIANLLSVPWLEENGYLVTKTYDKWFVHAPDGYTIHFSVEKDGLCHGMPLTCLHLRRSTLLQQTIYCLVYLTILDARMRKVLQWWKRYERILKDSLQRR